MSTDTTSPAGGAPAAKVNRIGLTRAEYDGAKTTLCPGLVLGVRVLELKVNRPNTRLTVVHAHCEEGILSREQRVDTGATSRRDIGIERL